jgi:glycerol uptake facilitator-like aquaporin
MRTLGPALVAGHFDAVWVCTVSPIAGGVLAALLYDNFIPEAETPD